VRNLTQPGPASLPRRICRPAREAGSFRIQLAPGEDLSNGLVAALTARGIADAAVELLSGTFEVMSYLTGQPDDSGQRVATYGAPTRLDGPVRLIGGNAMLGRDAAGRPLLHCHAVVVDRAGGVHGGHLPPGVCRLGPGGAVAIVVALAGAGFRVAADAETNFDIFQPAELA